MNAHCLRFMSINVAMIFTYWTGSSSPDTEFLDFWFRHVPGFRVFSDRDVVPIIESRHQALSRSYRSIRLPAARSDIARLLLLQEYGGLYIDAHMSCPDFGSLSDLLSECGNFELGVFDVIPWRRRAGDRHFVNGSIYSRRNSGCIALLIETVSRNVIRHYDEEMKAFDDGTLQAGQGPQYNLAVMTGAWNLRSLFFDATAGSLELRPDFKDKVLVIQFQNDTTSPLQYYRFYRYRAPNTHWSERQKSEPLFEISGHDEPPASAARGPNDLHNAILLGDALNQQQRYGETLALLLPELAFAPEHHWLNFHLGRAYLGIGNRDMATRHFLVAAESDYPHRVGAMYEVVNLELSAGKFERIDLLDKALNLPGNIDERDGAAGQKRYYYFQILFLKAMLTLRANDLVACDDLLEKAYDFSLANDERLFGFGWILDLLRALPPQHDLKNLEYVRQRLLHSETADSISYETELNKLPDDATVLEIGAMDGVRFDPLHQHLVSRKWNAVVVEPLPDMFELLRANYSAYPWVKCVNVAISDTSGPMSLFRVKPETVAARGLGEWIVGISSPVKGPTLSYWEDIVSEQSVRGLSFSDFVEEYRIKRLDVIQIDTGGYDWKILDQIDLGRWSIKIIRIDVMSLRPRDRLKVFSTLRSAGYAFHYDRMDITAMLHAERSGEMERLESDSVTR